MNIFNSFEEAKSIRNPIVTTGSFDGVHIGHKAILNRLKMLADKYDGETVLITFDPHPRKVLYPETAGRDLKFITSGDEKLKLLEEAGLENLIIIEFTMEFSKITSEQFVRDFLYGILHARVIVVGFNHHFGFKKEGNYKQLWEWQGKYNFESEEIPEQEVQKETVSSTKIRQAISSGNIQRTNAYLDHYYMITGKPDNYFYEVPKDLPPLVKLTFTEEYKLVPSPGIYAITVKSGENYSKAMVIINCGKDDKTEILINIFDELIFPLENNITSYFHKKVQGAVNFSDSTTPFRINSAKEDISELIY